MSTKSKECECDKCEEVFRQEANLLNHKKVCSGMVASSKEEEVRLWKGAVEELLPETPEDMSCCDKHCDNGGRCAAARLQGKESDL